MERGKERERKGERERERERERKRKRKYIFNSRLQVRIIEATHSVVLYIRNGYNRLTLTSTASEVLLCIVWFFSLSL